MLELLEHGHPLDKLQPVVTAADLVACQRAVREVHVDDKVRRYLMQIVHETRTHDDLSLGASPRHRWPCFALARRWRPSWGVASCCPTTSNAWRRPCSRTG